MTAPNDHRTASAHRTRSSAILIVGALIVLLLPLAAPALNAVRPAGLPLGYALVAHAVPVLLAGLVLLSAQAGRTPPVAGIGTVVVLTAAGALLTNGFDGLAMMLGAASAVFLAAVPSGARGYGESNTETASTPVSGIALAIAAAFIIAAELRLATAGIGQISNGVGPQFAAVAAASVVMLSLALAPVAISRKLPGLVLTTLALVIVGLAAAMVWRDGPLSLLSMPAVTEITALEDRLREKRLADPATLRIHTSAFLRTDIANFASLTAILAVGLAALTTGMFAMGPYRPHQHKASAVAWGRGTAAAVLLIAGLVPALTAAGKRDFIAAFDSGIKIGAPPEWFMAQVRSGAVEVCGKADVTSQKLSELCGSGFGRNGLLRLQDMQINSDTGVLTLLAATGSAPWIVALLVIVGVLGAGILSCQSGLLLADRCGVAGRRGIVAGAGILVLLAAAALAWIVADVVALLAMGAGIAAVATLPGFLASRLLGRTSQAGLALATAIGIATILATGLAAKVAPHTAFEWSGARIATPASVTRRMETLKSQAAAASSERQRRSVALQAARLAEERVTWVGLRPAPSAIHGLLAAILVALFAALLSRAR